MRIWIIFLVLPLLLGGCNTFDKPETIPSYIYVEQFSLTTDSGTEGENTHAIKDAWVYADGELLGIFELPARVPILADGVKTIELRPGIHNNGISGDRQVYPFYEPYIENINLVKDSVITVTPTTSYKSNLEFKFDDFESAGQLLIKDALSDTSWVIVSGGPTGKFGRLILDGNKQYAYMHTDENYNLPKLGTEIYLELDVRTNSIVRLGVIDESGTATPQRVYNNFGVNKPSNGEAPVWKKLYIQLTNTLSYESQATQHEFFIDVIKENDISVAQVDIDNIKLVHF